MPVPTLPVLWTSDNQAILSLATGGINDPFGLQEFRHARIRAGFGRVYSVLEFAERALVRVPKPDESETRTYAYCYLAAEAVANYYRITPEEMFNKNRSLEPLAGARQIAMAISVTCGGFQLTQVGKAFGRDRTTVAHGVQNIEQKRTTCDDFDVAVEMMENAVIDHWSMVGDGAGFVLWINGVSW